MTCWWEEQSQNTTLQKRSYPVLGRESARHCTSASSASSEMSLCGIGFGFWGTPTLIAHGTRSNINMRLGFGTFLKVKTFYINIYILFKLINGRQNKEEKTDSKQIKQHEKILRLVKFAFVDGSLLPRLEKDIYMSFKHSTTECNYRNILYQLENYQNCWHCHCGYVCIHFCMCITIWAIRRPCFPCTDWLVLVKALWNCKDRNRVIVHILTCLFQLMNRINGSGREQSRQLHYVLLSSSAATSIWTDQNYAYARGMLTGDSPQLLEKELALDSKS